MYLINRYRFGETENKICLFNDGTAFFIVPGEIIQFFADFLTGCSQFVFTGIRQAFQIDGILADFDFYITVVLSLYFHFSIFSSIICPVCIIGNLERDFYFYQFFFPVFISIQLLNQFFIGRCFQIVK